MANTLYVTLYMVSGRQHSFSTKLFIVDTINDELGRKVIKGIDCADIKNPLFVQHIEEIEVVNDELGSMAEPHVGTYNYGFADKRIVTRSMYS